MIGTTPVTEPMLDLGAGGGALPQAGDTVGWQAAMGDKSVPFESTQMDVFKTNQDMKSDNFVSGSAGWRIKGNGDVEFNNGTFRGALTASTIDIGGSDATSFHVDVNGNMWLGAATFATATFSVSSAGAMIATSGTIAGWNITTTTLRSGASDAASNVLIDSANTLIRLGPTSGNYLNLDGANLRIRSSNYVSGFAGAGFTLEPDLLEVGNIAARGLIRSSVMEYNNISVHSGSDLIAQGGDVLNADMTAADNSTFTIKGTDTFAVNDRLRIKDGTNDEWLLVTGTGSAPTYAVTRDQAAAYAPNSNPAWKKGASVVNYGQSGAGGIYMTASDTNAPYISVFTHAGSPWSTLTTQLRLGNLNGYLGYVADTFGLGVGSSSGTDSNITVDPTNGIRIRNGTTNKITFDNSGNATLLNLTVGGSLNISTSGNIKSGQTAYNTGTGFFLEYNSGSPRLSIGDGTTTNSLTWNASLLTVNGTPLTNQDIYGDGSDGDVTISSNTTLTTDMYYNNLTVNNTKNLITGSYRVFVKGTTTNNGSITRDGNAGTAGTNGAGQTGGALGAGGAALAAGFFNAGEDGKDGTTGGNGNATGANGSISADATAGDAVTFAMGAAGKAGARGGNGGNSNGIPAGGVAGTAGTAGAGTAPTNKIRTSAELIVFRDYTTATPTKLNNSGGTGGSSGGGGGGSINVGFASGGGGGGAGAGSTGGTLLLCSRIIINTGTISANGGAGAIGGNGAAATGQSCGGGGGGAGSSGGTGGVVMLIYGLLTNSGTIQAVGGALGAGGTGGAHGPVNGSDGVVGANGVAGNSGTVIQLQV